MTIAVLVIRSKLFFIGALLLTACASQEKLTASDDSARDGMTSVVNTVTIAAPVDAVFALVTTARFWPQWHPATQAVGGVTERPYGLGDRIYERGRIGQLEFQTSWRVAEYARGSRVVLQSEKSPTRITYSFQARDRATVFTRNLQYKRENFATTAANLSGAEQLMRSQSEQAVNQLKGLVEEIVRQETIEIP
jgi:uncharacterized protein YndB with AHSA1/START domain